MSFEIKYDKNRNVIPNPEVENKLEAAKVAAWAQQEQPTEIKAAAATEVSAPASDLSESPNAQPQSEAESTAQPEERISHDPGPSDVEYQEATDQAQTRQQKFAQESFKELREKAKNLERERDEYMRKLQEAQAAKDDEDLSINDSDLAEGKHLKKLQQEIKKLKQESEVNRQQSTLSAAEARLRSQYNDFDSVVTAASINQLRESYPELAASINSNNDIYSKAVSAYTMIKKLGIHQEPIYNAEKARIAQNATKPKPSATIAPQKSDSPLSQANSFANGLTPALQKQLRAEMEAARGSY